MSINDSRARNLKPPPPPPRGPIKVKRKQGIDWNAIAALATRVIIQELLEIAREGQRWDYLATVLTYRKLASSSPHPGRCKANRLRDLHQTAIKPKKRKEKKKKYPVKNKTATDLFIRGAGRQFNGGSKFHWDYLRRIRRRNQLFH